MNLLRHRNDAEIIRIYSEVSGLPCGKLIRHWDGRQDAVHRPEVIRVSARQLESTLGVPLNTLRQGLYEQARAQGISHDEAVGRLFREGRVNA